MYFQLLITYVYKYCFQYNNYSFYHVCHYYQKKVEIDLKLKKIVTYYFSQNTV